MRLESFVVIPGGNLRLAPHAAELCGGVNETQIPCGDDNKKDKRRGVSTISVALFMLCVLCSATVVLQAQYAPPPSSAHVLHGVDFAAAQTIAPELTQLYQACDASTQRGGCATDPARNTVLLKFPDAVTSEGTVNTAGPVFFDAKMAIDADGSALSKAAERPNQPETAFRYPAGPNGLGASLDSEHVPYIVMPLGSFRQATGVELGDLAAVVKDGQVHFAIVGDLGPRTHIGEGSMALHAAFGHLDCRAHDAQGNCSQFVDVSLDPPVLYFCFPDSRKLLIDGLGPENVNARIDRLGMQLWSAFLIEQGPARVGRIGGLPTCIRGWTMSRAVGAWCFSMSAYPALAGWAEMSRAFGAERLRMTPFKVEVAVEGNVN